MLLEDHFLIVQQLLVQVLGNNFQGPVFVGAAREKDSFSQSAVYSSKHRPDSIDLEKTTKNPKGL